MTNLSQGQKPLAIALMGPTAAGKTDLAIALKEQLNGEIISVDSALVYKGLDIGTAKPTPEELARAPHRLINIIEPDGVYNAADFCRDAKAHINEIIAAGRTPILVGGTMMYFKALLEGMSSMPAADLTVRERIEKLAGDHGWPYIHAVLAKADPKIAAAIHPNHSQRLSRALEVYWSSGIPMSRWQRESQPGLLNDYQWVQIAVAPIERKVLHERIALRFVKMLEQGFLEEMKVLRARTDLSVNSASMRTVGYRQAWEYLDGDVDYATFIEKGVAATRQLAKRQLTWLRGWHDLSWVYTQDSHRNMLSSDEILAKALKLIGDKAI